MSSTITSSVRLGVARSQPQHEQHAHPVDSNPTATPTHTFLTPPDDIAALVDTTAEPGLFISPTRHVAVLATRPSLPSLADLSRAEDRVGGVRFSRLDVGLPSRRAYWNGLVLVEDPLHLRETGKCVGGVGGVGGAAQRSIRGLESEDGAVLKVAGFQWSPSARYVAFIRVMVKQEDVEEAQLWVLDTSTATARVLVTRLNITIGSWFTWVDDNHLICKVCDEEMNNAHYTRTTAALYDDVPDGPVVQHNETGKKAPARTYQDLIKSPADEELFRVRTASVLVLASLDGGAKVLLDGRVGSYYRLSASPSGRFVLLHELHEPYSYRVPYHRFETSVTLLDLALDAGEVRAVHELARLPVADRIPISFDARREGPRCFSWSDAHEEDLLLWVEAQDGGDPFCEAEVRDAVFALDVTASDDAQPRVVATLERRYRSISWVDDKRFLLTSRWRKDRQTRTYLVDLSDGSKRVIFSRSFDDAYSDPGSPIYRYNGRGCFVVDTFTHPRTGHLSALYQGQGATPEGDFPFIRVFDFETLEAQELWRCQAGWYEKVTRIVRESDTAWKVLVRRESQDTNPNYWTFQLRCDLSEEQAAPEAGPMLPMTDFPHPYPELRDVRRELIHYTREDGVELTADLYLPPRAVLKRLGVVSSDDEAIPPLPTVAWAYPREFKDKKAAGQVRGSPNRFVRLRNPLYFLMAGYAVVSGPAMPIVAEGDEEPNDTFVEQLVASAQALVDYICVERQVSDPKRLAIGGHSYGAFMAVHLVAHTDLFAAAIARSGCYNRSLTPFGFQREERTFFNTPDLYVRMSPLTHAASVSAPVLLVHGQLDNNSGTYPQQSEAMFAALSGLGKAVKLVMLPLESHGYRSRECVLHQLAEMLQWLDKHV